MSNEIDINKIPDPNPNTLCAICKEMGPNGFCQALSSIKTDLQISNKPDLKKIPRDCPLILILTKLTTSS